MTELHGVGTLTAGKILGRVRTITRFHSAAAFASYTGTAPIEVSSSEVIRHRLSRARRSPTELLLACHGHDTNPASHPKQGLLHAETIRRQKSQRSDALREKTPFRCHLPTTSARRDQGSSGEPGRTLGGDYIVTRGQLNTAYRLFGQVTSRAHQRPTNKPPCSQKNLSLREAPVRYPHQGSTADTSRAAVRSSGRGCRRLVGW